MIEGRVIDRIKQSLTSLLEQSKQLAIQKTNEEWYGNQEVCQLLRISLRTLQSYRDKGIIPYSQIGHKCYYKVKDIELFIQSCESDVK